MADIEKVFVCDPRILQNQAKFSVLAGALSNSGIPYVAISATPSQMLFNCYISSENVFVDRHFLVSATGYFQFKVTIDPAAPLVVNQPICVLGRDWSLAPYPINSLATTTTCTINDTNVTFVGQDMLQPILRMVDRRADRRVRTSTTMLDKYVYYNDAFGTINNPINGYDSMPDMAEAGNGCYSNVRYTDQGGAELAGLFSAPAAVVPTLGQAYSAINGVPVCNGAQTSGDFYIFIKMRSCEPFVLSPFIFNEMSNPSTGFFGLNNLQFIMTLSSPSRLLRWNNRANGQLFADFQFNSSAPAGQPLAEARVNIIALTPNLSISLPPKSIIPMQNYSRYISAAGTSIAAGFTGMLTSNTITLPQIPDYLIVYARPTDFATVAGNVGDAYLPIASQFYGASNNPLSVQWDNYSGLLSSYSSEQLYYMSQANGLEMDYNTWIGAAHSASGTNATGVDATSTMQGQIIPLVGGPLVLAMGRDVALQTGQAPGIVGNFVLQLSLTVRNQFREAKVPQLVVIAVNSGFLETIRGSSRVLNSILSEQAVIEASKQQPLGSSTLNRLVGGASKWLANSATGLAGGAFGYGRSAAGVSAAGVSAAGLSAAGLSAAGVSAAGRQSRQSVAARLM